MSFIIDFGSYGDDSGVWYHEQIGPFDTLEDAVAWGNAYYVSAPSSGGGSILAGGDYEGNERAWTVLELSDPKEPRRPLDAVEADAGYAREDRTAPEVIWNGVKFVAL